MIHTHCFMHNMTNIHMIVRIWLSDIWSHIWVHAYDFTYMIHTYCFTHMINIHMLVRMWYQTDDHAYEFSITTNVVVQVSVHDMYHIWIRYIIIREIIEIVQFSYHWEFRIFEILSCLFLITRCTVTLSDNIQLQKVFNNRI